MLISIFPPEIIFMPLFIPQFVFVFCVKTTTCTFSWPETPGKTKPVNYNTYIVNIHPQCEREIIF